MASKQRRTKTTGSRAVAENIAEMIAKMNPGTLDEFESEVWARLDSCARGDIVIRREDAISEMFGELNMSDASEVESLMMTRLDEAHRNIILANRTRGIGKVIGESAGKMTPSDAREVEAMISAALERQDRNEVGEVGCEHRYPSPWWREAR